MAELLSDPQMSEHEARAVLDQFAEYVLASRRLNARVSAALANPTDQPDLRPLLRELVMTSAKMEGRSPADQISALARRSSSSIDFGTLFLLSTGIRL